MTAPITSTAYLPVSYIRPETGVDREPRYQVTEQANDAGRARSVGAGAAEQATTWESVFTPGGAGLTIQSDNRAFMFLGGSSAGSRTGTTNYRPQRELLEAYENQFQERQPDDFRGHYVDIFA